VNGLRTRDRLQGFEVVAVDKKNCRWHDAAMEELMVIADPAAAELSLDPIRARLLTELRDPASASTLAARLGMPRQKVNYHVRALERHGLVELVEERRKGNMTERLMQSTAAAFVISPSTLGPLEPDTTRTPDRLSARWLVALAARTIREVGSLLDAAADARRRVATFALDAEVRFATAADRAAFASELADTVASLVGRYHDEEATGGRRHRLVLAIHPSHGGRPAAPDPEDDDGA
jgi:DNA-binding transcriptional ArsR family regulator